MLNKIVPIIVVVLGAAGGGFAAQMLQGSDKPAAEASGSEADHSGDHGDGHSGDHKDDHHGDDKSKDKHGDKAASSSDLMYYKFSREFVVPVMRDKRVHSLVILNLSIEADQSLSGRFFAEEPKIRDNIMTTLIHLSNEGTILDDITDVESYETIRTMILRNLESIFADGVHNILIMDIAKQDV